MQRFDFNLARALRVRETQLRAAETALHQARSRRGELQAALDAANESAADAGKSSKARPWVNPAELANVSYYTARLHREARQWLGRLTVQDEAIKKQELAVVQARRHVRMLEMLRDRRHAEWQIEADREASRCNDDFIAAQNARSRRKGGWQP